MNKQELIDQLKSASEGLLWLSESDYPFTTVYWEDVDDINTKLLKVTNCTSETKIETKELDSFFNRATVEKDWYNDEEMAECKRYQELVKLLQTHPAILILKRVCAISASPRFVKNYQSLLVQGF